MRVYGIPDPIPYSDIRGRKVCTIGRKFGGLGTRAFRQLLREAGADVGRYPTKTTEIVILGDHFSIGSVADAMTKVSDQTRIPMVHYARFLDQFLHDLKDIPVKGGVPFGDYWRRASGGRSGANPS